MITARWASFVLAVLCLVCIRFTPTGPASISLAGLSFLFFLVLCWTMREKVG